MYNKVMIIIVGLGNPGKKFKETWHNVGFLAVDELSRKNDFPDWQESKNNNCLYTKKEIAGKETELIKPLIFMNNSGSVVRSIAKKHNLRSEDIFVVHDDIDLALGKIRIVKNRGSAGHKGVASIIKELGTKNFVRFRIGIRPLEIKKVKDLKAFVLQKLSKKDKKIFEEVAEKAGNVIEISLLTGLEKAMQEIN